VKRKHLETTTKFGNIDAQVPTPRHPQVRHPQEPDKMSLCVSGFGRRIRTLDPGLTHPPQLDCPDAKGGNPDGTFSGPEVFGQRRQKPFILSRWGRYKQESIHIYIYIFKGKFITRLQNLPSQLLFGVRSINPALFGESGRTVP